VKGITHYPNFILNLNTATMTKREKIINEVDKWKNGYYLTGKDGVFEFVAKKHGYSPKTIETYYYCDKLRPKAKGKKR
jgi:hypothetical protein